MEGNQRSLPIGTLVALDKGKPPLVQPYHGSDAEPYLTPEYLRGRALAALATHDQLVSEI